MNHYELYSKKYAIAEDNLGSNERGRVKRERTYSRERRLRMIFFDLGHLQHER